MKQKKLLIFLLLLLFGASGCASNFQRIGNPDHLISNKEPLTALYGAPFIYVDINVAGRNTGNWFGVIGMAAGMSRDKNRNQQALDNLLKNGIQPFAQQEILSTITKVVNNAGGPIIKDTLLLPADSAKAKSMIEALPTKEGFFAIDTFVNFQAAQTDNQFGASIGVIEGISTKVEIHLALMSSGKERKPVWKDVYVCELKSVQKSLVENEAALAKELVKTAILNLKPWIENDLKGQDIGKHPYAKVVYRNYTENEGHILHDDDDYISIRVKEGMTRIIPKAFIREVKPIDKEA